MSEDKLNGQSVATVGPVAVGGVGGSGTRLIARCLASLGVELGSDLNEALDNLWFTLLFKRRDILLLPSLDQAAVCDLFMRRMGGKFRPSEAERAVVRRLANRPRPLHPAEWLAERAVSFLDTPSLPVGRWGWKEPNTHVFAEMFLQADPALRYIHLYRNGLEMAFNRNQQQAELWGPVLLGTDGEPSPARSLAYWRAAHERMLRLHALHAPRILMLRFETLLAEPQATMRRLAAFCGLDAPEGALDALAQGIVVPVSRIVRDARFDALAPDDLAYLDSLGFDVG